MVKTRLKKGQLDHFRRLARNSSLEILAYLIGEVVNPNLTVIDSIEYTSDYALQTPSQVCWYVREYERVQELAEERGKRIIGFIHSHPSWDAVMSPADYDMCVKEGYRVCGIVSTQRRSTRARFWITDSALPCEIVYAKKKGS